MLLPISKLTLSQTEMRAAKQQAQDLNQTHGFLNSMITPDGSPSKLQAPTGDVAVNRHSNGRVKAPRVDHATRFSDPPAPPPQQPLPEKPDSAKSSPVNAISISGFLKRSDTAKPPINGVAQSPVAPQPGQVQQLINALEIATKELDSQNTHIKQLEDMLKEERSAREAAEERARKIEEIASARPVNKIEADESIASSEAASELSSSDRMTTAGTTDGNSLQQKLESMVAEMQRLKNDVEQANRRADTAEKEAASARSSLAEMIERIKKENESAPKTDSELCKPSSNSQDGSAESTDREDGAIVRTKHGAGAMNGHVRNPSRLPQAVETVMATVLRENHNVGDLTAQSAPYVSMLGVVLIGVGVMAYLNSWQKGDK